MIVGAALQSHDESAAESIVQAELQYWQMPDGQELREVSQKSDPRKVAILIKRHTSARNTTEELSNPPGHSPLKQSKNMP